MDNNSTSKILTLSCVARGIPNHYRYRSWQQVWPGNGVIRNWTGSDHSLHISNITYEHTGIYKCFASNDVVNHVTGELFMEGKSFVVVQCKYFFKTNDQCVLCVYGCIHYNWSLATNGTLLTNYSCLLFLINAQNNTFIIYICI